MTKYHQIFFSSVFFQGIFNAVSAKLNLNHEFFKELLS